MPSPDQIDHATRVGERRVDETGKTRFVRGVFDSVAPRYDLMNDLMSAGLHRLWKRELVAPLVAGKGKGRVIDVAGGTGDIAFLLARRGFDVDVVDINASMLSVGRNRTAGRSASGSVNWVCGDAEALPLPDGCADACTISFGIRNVTHIERALAEARRILGPGGRFLCLEFGKVAVPALDRLYANCSSALLPRLGSLVAGDRESYRYLVESIRRFPDRERFADMVAETGLARVSTRNLLGGVAVLTSGWRL